MPSRKPDDAATAETADERKDLKCPNCGGDMIQHGPENPHKAGAWHCDACGGCWIGDPLELRVPGSLGAAWPKEQPAS